MTERLCILQVLVFWLSLAGAATAEPGIVATLPGPLVANCRLPSSVIADPASSGWLVASAGQASVVRVAADGTPVAALRLPGRPTWLGPAADGVTVLAVSTEDNMLFRVDPLSWAVVSGASIGSRPVCAVEYGPHIFVAGALKGFLSRHHGTTLACLGMIQADEDPSCMAVDTARGRLLVGSAATGKVSAINAATGVTGGSVRTGTMPVAICVDGARSVAYVVDEIDSSVSVIDLSVSPLCVAATVPVGDCPLAAALDETTGILYVSCNTNPNSSVWQVDPTTRTAAKLVEFPYGPDPVSVAIRPGVGLCVANKCVDGVSLASFDGGTPTTVPVSYVLRDIAANPASGHVYAAYSSAVPCADGDHAGVVGVWDSRTLAPISTFPCVAPAAIAPWVGGSGLVVGGADGYVCEYAVPSGALIGGAKPLPSRPVVAWLGLCVAENHPSLGPVAFIEDMWTATGRTFALPAAAPGATAFSGYAGNSAWLGYWEQDARLSACGSSYVTVSLNAGTDLSAYRTAVGNPGRPSQPGQDGLVYVPSTRRPPLSRVYAYTAAGGQGSGFKLALRAQADVPDRHPVAAARNELTGRVYVANYSDGTVAVFDGALRRSDTIAVGGHPFRLWVDETTNLVYVGDCGSDLVTVIEDIASIPTLSVSEAAATPDGIVARVQGGVVKSLPLSRAATGYLWYYFEVEPEDHSATLTVWRQQSPPAVEIGSWVEMVGTIQTLPVSTSTTKKSIVARELTIQ